MKKVSFTIVLLIMGLTNIIAQNAPKSGPCPGMPQFTDPRDGKTYNTVQIGDRCWMKENLNYGNFINSSLNQTDNAIIEKYCYGNNENNCDTYGGLYQWNEIMQYAALPSQKQGIPPGWEFFENPSNCIIAIPLTSNPNINGFPLEPGDYIGAFYVNDEGNQACGGCVEWNGNQLIVLVTFGNDTLWGSKNGFWEGELFRYKVYSWSLQMEFDASVTCSSGNCQFFNNYGLAAIESLDAFGTIPPVSQGICPPGWLVPTDEEWCALTTSLDPDVDCNGVGFGGTNAGGSLKETGTTHWNAPNAGVTNISEFTGLPGGYFTSVNRSFHNIGCNGIFHTSSTNGSDKVGRWVWLLSSDDERVSRISFTPGGGYSLRCIRDESAVAQLSVTPENQDVSEIAGTTTFEVTSNTAWTVSESVSWLSVDPLGGSNNGTLTVSYDANLVTEARIGQITITAAGGTPVVNVTVTQAGIVPTLTVTPTNQSVSPDAGITTFDVTSNTTWTVSETVSWLSVDPLGGSNNGTLTVSYDANLVTEARIGQIIITAAGGTPVVNVTVTQAGMVPTLTVTPTNQGVSSDAGTTTFEVTSNTTWTVSENTDWLTVTPTNGNLNQTLTVNYDANTTTLTRIGEITITAAGGNPVVVVTVTQQGEQQVWACGQPLTDNRDGQTYTTVQIGDQCWMAENLNVGAKLDGVNEQSNNGTIEKYCFDNLETNCDVYGGLYQWNEMMGYSITPGVQGICPAGWHLPTDAEWCTLEQEVDPTIACSSTGWHGVDGGGKLKESGTTHWISPNTGATNSSGFTALPGGNRTTNGFFYSVSYNGNWWSSSPRDASNAWNRYLYYGNAQVDRGQSNKSNGFSVRCLKD